MTYQDAPVTKPSPALVACPALPALPALPVRPADRAPWRRPSAGRATDACRPRSSQACRQALRAIHEHQATSPTTAAPTRTNAVSMFSP
ncbi:hypothetical protein ACH4F6_14395 [Streptomyces sp. NPDC017936]|uniref:hypothetical protein n=1 Tax=Streptomyces sp. NPDC017936 TaxID=3365016 RepID=UPI00378752DE